MNEHGTSRRFARPLLVILVVAAAGAALVLGIVLASGSRSLSGAGAAQVASVRHGCQEWAAANPAQAQGQGSAWCDSMTRWMSQRVVDDEAGPQGMWGDPDHMLSACRQWMAADLAGSAADPGAWCGGMVDWMRSNLRSWMGQAGWGDWMMHGSMMRQ